MCSFALNQKLSVMGLRLLIWSWLTISAPGEQQLANIETPQIIETPTEAPAPAKTKVQKTGIASFYHDKFVGRKTATGEVFSNDDFTAASNHFKLGTFVKVTNISNGRFIYVKINDRMGHPTRMIDLTNRAAHALKFVNKGITRVKIEQVPASEGKRQVLAQIAPDTEQGVPNNVL